MTVIFDDLINEEGLWMRAPQRMQKEVVNFEDDNTQRFKEAQELFRKAHENKKKIQQLLGEAEEVYLKAREEVLRLVGCEDYEDDLLSLKFVEREGSVDKKLLMAFYPKVNLKKISKPNTFYWTVKWKGNNE